MIQNVNEIQKRNMINLMTLILNVGFSLDVILYSRVSFIIFIVHCQIFVNLIGIIVVESEKLYMKFYISSNLCVILTMKINNSLQDTLFLLVCMNFEY